MSITSFYPFAGILINKKDCAKCFAQQPARLVGTDFAAAVSFELDMKATDTERVLAELTRVTDGRVESLKEEERFAPWEEGTP